jgi:hypothetical protein
MSRNDASLSGPVVDLAPDLSDSQENLSASRRLNLVRIARGILVGAILVVLVVIARRTGLLQGGLALAVLATGCLLVPTSRQLSRRILIAGAAGLGWLPMGWWFPAPLLGLGRMTMVLALLLGGLGAWVTNGRSPRSRLASLVPNLRPVDALPFIAAIASAAALRDLLTAHTGSRVLTLLIPGWDNSSHYAIVHMIRIFGVMTNAAPLTTFGEAPAFTSYPQGFHAVVAATMELLTSPTVGSADHELVVYAHSVALVVIVAVTALVAGICALPRLRRRPAVAAPLVALVTAGLMAGSGATALQDGFANFVVACALVGMLVLLVVPLHRVISPVILGAIGGAIVGIAYDWAPLLVLALLALFTLVVPLSRRRWAASPGQRLAASAIALAVSLSLLAVVDVLSVLPIATQFTAPGAVTPPAIGLLITIVAGSAGLTLAVFTRARRAPQGAPGGTAARTAALALVPVGGTAIAGALAVLQLLTATKVGYYFWKFAIGLELACLVVIVTAVAAMVTTRSMRSSGHLSRTIVAATGGLLTLAASQAFGYIGPPLTRFGASQVGPITQARESARLLAKKPNPTGERLLAALHVQEQDLSRQIVFLPYPRDVRTDPVLAGRWYLALTGTFAGHRPNAAIPIKDVGSTAEGAAACASVILRADPTKLIVVGPDVLDAL